jgi:hypothetical protein
VWRDFKDDRLILEAWQRPASVDSLCFLLLPFAAAEDEDADQSEGAFGDSDGGTDSRWA